MAPPIRGRSGTQARVILRGIACVLPSLSRSCPNLSPYEELSLGEDDAMRPTDIELMLRARADDAVAFQELVNRYRAPLRRYFASLLADRSQADDFVQETFLRLWLCRQRYEPSGKFSTYLYQIGKHYWLNQRKKFRPEIAVEGLDEAVVAGPIQVTQPQAVLLQRHRDGQIRKAIAGLPEHYRVVFTLCHFDGLRYAEIAASLGIPVGTVKSRMAQAVLRLRQALLSEE
jgi:RNA polymerase sigma-70 factor (ECF subfamily)